MTNDTRTPEEIEREIEIKRSALTSNLDDLQQKFSIDTLVRQIGDQFREHGGDLGRSISDQVKANPIPLALTGIGLAWMMMGSSQKPVSAGGYYPDEDDYRRTRLGQGRPYTPPVTRISDYDSDPSWSRDDGEDNYGTVAKERLAEGAETVRSGVGSVSSSVAGAASSARSSLASGARAAQHTVASAGSRIAEGTEGLTEEGRRRVIAARRKAVEVKRSAMASMSGSADAAADFYDRQPLVIGALALAVGAALGGALPRTKTEDDLMGGHSDALFHEAERIYEEEKAKVSKVAQAVTDEVKDIASETKADLDSRASGDRTAVDAIADKATIAAERVADAAKSAGRDEKPGRSDV